MCKNMAFAWGKCTQAYKSSHCFSESLDSPHSSGVDTPTIALTMECFSIVGGWDMELAAYLYIVQ